MEWTAAMERADRRRQDALERAERAYWRRYNAAINAWLRSAGWTRRELREMDRAFAGW